MNKFKNFGKALKRGAKRAAPALSIFAGLGLASYGAYKVAKAVPSAKEHIQQKKEELDKDKLTIKETVQACGKDFAEPLIFTASGIAAVTAGVCDYEHSLKTLGTTMGAATALLNEQIKETNNVLGDTVANSINQKAVANVVSQDGGGRIQTPGGIDIYIEELTGREFLSSEAWIRDCFSRYMDDFLDNPDERPCLNDFYSELAPTNKKATTPLGNCITFPYDVNKPTKYNRVDLYFKPSETVDGKAAFSWSYSSPLEYCPY